MGVLDKLKPDREIVKKIKDLEIKIKPFTSRDLPLIMKAQNARDPESQARAFFEIFKKVMKDNFSDITDKELEEVSLEVFGEVIEGVAEVHGFKEKLEAQKFFQGEK